MREAGVRGCVPSVSGNLLQECVSPVLGHLRSAARLAPDSAGPCTH